MMFGVYPFDQQWRPALVIVVLCGLLVISAMKRFWRPSLALIWVIGLTLAFWLMGGGLGLAPVRTEQWGGLPVTLILSIFGIGLAFPLGILLALGRRSKLPIVRSLSVIYIEVVRGVPLITVLFMASVMFALFMPEGLRIDQLLRAQVAIILFVAAYLAEAVRGGLQAVPKGQYEAAEALGMPYWKTTSLIILPQALKIAVPPTVGFLVQVIKGTALASVIGFVELTKAGGMIANVTYQPLLVYGCVALIYFALCFPISLYAGSLERKLHVGRH
jgi:general L-amino acid transport system permease protein